MTVRGSTSQACPKLPTGREGQGQARSYFVDADYTELRRQTGHAEKTPEESVPGEIYPKERKDQDEPPASERLQSLAEAAECIEELVEEGEEALSPDDIRAPEAELDREIPGEGEIGTGSLFERKKRPEEVGKVHGGKDGPPPRMSARPLKRSMIAQWEVANGTHA
jgi:hypothetical protein